MAKRRTSRRKKKKVSALTVVCVALFGVAVLFAAVRFGPQLFSRVFGGDFIYPQGTVIAETDVSGMTEKEAVEAVRVKENAMRAEYLVKLVSSSGEMELSGKDPAFTFNTEELVREAADLCRGVSAQSGEENQEFELTATISRDKLAESLSAFIGTVEQPVENPELLGFDFESEKFMFSSGKKGVGVDEKTLLDNILYVLENQKTGTVTVPVYEIGFDEKVLAENERMTMLSTFSTESTNGYNGNHNMALALSRMNGLVIEAGGTFSFHGAVGDSMSDDSGFLPAGAYRDGKLVSENGGGICQAATTFYGAALRADMEIVERSCHLQPASYVPIGLDATVNYPDLDLKLKNNSDYPIYVVAGMDGVILTVTLYGCQSPDYDYIDVKGSSTGSVPRPDPVFEVDDSLAPGEYVRQRSGYSGYMASASRIYYQNGEIIKTAALPDSVYSEVAPLYSVGPGTDTSLIPSDSESGKVAVTASAEGTENNVNRHSEP